MQAVVKTPRIDVRIKGTIPPRLISVLKREFGEHLHLGEEDEEQMLSIFDTDWYQEISKEMTPGDNLKIYRANHHLTQAQLGELLGGIPRQHISNMERGTRPVSVRNARKFAAIFKVSAAKFI